MTTARPRVNFGNCSELFSRAALGSVTQLGQDCSVVSQPMQASVTDWP